MKLTELVSNSNKRVGALETTNFDETTGIARITKIYGNVKITAVITTRKYNVLTPSNTLYPSSGLYSEVEF